MIRLLIIGKDAEQWRQGLGFWEGETLEVDTEALPAGGIRTFAETSPDAVAIAEPDGSRTEPIIEAIRERPLGQIVPVVVLGERVGEADFDVAAAVDSADGAKALVVELEDILEVSLEPGARHAQTSSAGIEVSEPSQEGDLTQKSTEIPTVRPGQEAPSQNASLADAMDAAGGEGAQGEGGQVEHRDYVIEPLEESAPQSHPGIGGPSRQSTPSGLNPAERPAAEDIRRKLKEVRHEDYFVILGLPRTAGADEVREAYRELKARHRPKILPDELADKFEAELEEINDALDDARAVLGDDDLRQAYLSRTTRK